MAQKNKQSQPEQKTDRVPDTTAHDDEFENAVTTEISDVLARAFDEDRSADTDDVYVTDAQLTAHVDRATDDVLAPGLLLNDRFEIVELVHSGGMSHVYKAVDLRRRPEGSGEIHVAIKMMRPAVASHEAARLSLEREAAKAQSLSHPNIINIFDFDDHDGQFFLVMEWLEGESVNALLRRTSGEQVASGLAATVIAGAAAGVQHAHAKDVVHADINPSNIFITDTGDIKLLDFGVARYTSSPEHSEDDRFAWVTQTYASPEVLSGLPPVFEDDVFSLACVAYRVLGGKHPFGGTLSLVAKHRGMTLESIPGLPDDEWRILRGALAYDRADRPGDVSEFAAWGADAEEIDESAGQLLRRLTSSLLRSPLAAVAAAIVLVGGLWLFQRGGDVEPVTAVDPAVPEQAVADQPVATSELSAAEMLLAEAAQALSEGRLVEPDERDARTLFREVLVIEPGNVEARQGLRTISNDFVQKAHDALNANDPAQAYAALAAATETDSANPAIEIVDQLLVSKGDRELVGARLAAATGDFDRVAQQLSRAEQYSHIDPGAIQSVRQQVEQSRRSDQLTDSLAVVDAHIADGRLLLPEGNNAHALLLELYEQHGDDARLRASMERLGERLLTRAAVAAADARVADATEMLDAVVVLGVLAPEVEAVRSSLVTPVVEPVVEEVQDTQVAAEQLEPAIEAEDVEDAPTQPMVGESLVAAVEAESTPEPQIAEAQSDEGLSTASAVEPATQAVPDPATTGAAAEPRRQTLQELGITKYVAPVFPRRAVRRRVTGMVEVGFVINADGSTDSIEVLQSRPGELFSQSATDAVSQWRFETREEMIPAQVTLRFETPE